MLALAEIFALWMKSHLTVEPLKQYFYIGLLVFQLFAKWNVRSLLEFWFCPSWKHNWGRPTFSLFNNFKLETCWLLICSLTIYFFEWKRRWIHINIHQNLQYHIKRKKKLKQSNPVNNGYWGGHRKWQVEIREDVRAFIPQGQNKLSVIARCRR